MGKTKTDKRSQGPREDDIDFLLRDFLRNIPDDERENLFHSLKLRFQKRCMTLSDIRSVIDLGTMSCKHLNTEASRNIWDILADVRALSNTTLGLVDRRGMFGVFGGNQSRNQQATDNLNEKVLTELLAVIFELNFECDKNRTETEKKKGKKSKEEKHQEKVYAEKSREIFLAAEHMLAPQEDTAERRKSRSGATKETDKKEQEEKTKGKKDKGEKTKSKGGFFRSTKHNKIDASDDAPGKHEDKKKKKSKKDAKRQAEMMNEIDPADNVPEDARNLQMAVFQSPMTDLLGWGLGYAQAYGAELRKKIRTTLRVIENDALTSRLLGRQNRNRRKSLVVKILQLGCMYA